MSVEALLNEVPEPTDEDINQKSLTSAGVAPINGSREAIKTAARYRIESKTEQAVNSIKRIVMKRRTFLIAGGVVGGGLLVGVGGFNYYANKRIKEFSGIGMGEGDSLNAFVRIRTDNTIVLAIPRTEMGQGIYTALSQLIAEELEADFSKVEVVFPQAEGPYTNFFMAGMKPADFEDGLTMMQKVFAIIPNIITGGSTSVSDAYNYYRRMGAMAREMLIAAAAREWQVSPKDCYAEKSMVINKKKRSNKNRSASWQALLQRKRHRNFRPLKTNLILN